MIDRQIGVFGTPSDVCAALQVFKCVQQKLAVSRFVFITRKPSEMRTRIQDFSYDGEFAVQDLDTFMFDSKLPFYLIVNLSSVTGSSVFEAAVRAIPVISVRPRHELPILESQQSAYLFSYQDLDTLKNILCHIADEPAEAERFALEAQKRTIEWCGESYLLRNYGTLSDFNGTSEVRSIAKSSLLASIPRRYFMVRGRGRRSEIALTFDDGPDPITTPLILEILSKYDVKATFFLVANRAEQYPDLAKAIVTEGHEVGSHSYSHPYFDRLSLAQATGEITAAKNMLENITGQACRLFRPPFGKLSAQSLFPAWLHGHCVVLWTVDLKDYKANEAAQIERRLAGQIICNGDIILYHGLNLASLNALPSVIKAAKAQGRIGVSVSHLV